MKYLITAGGTTEFIDNVRKITNQNPGELGKLLVSEILKRDKNPEIFFIAPKNVRVPASEFLKRVNVTTTESAYLAIKDVLSNNSIDVIIHSMSVSNYTTEKITNETLINKYLEDNNTSSISFSELSNEYLIDNSTKIPSGCSNLIVKLVPTTKIINKLRYLSPNSKIFGFKTVNDISKELLAQSCKKLLEKTDCDFVIGSDLMEINRTEHKATVFHRDGKEDSCLDKEDIAQKIVALSLKK